MILEAALILAASTAASTSTQPVGYCEYFTHSDQRTVTVIGGKREILVVKATRQKIVSLMPAASAPGWDSDSPFSVRVVKFNQKTSATKATVSNTSCRFGGNIK